MIGYGARADGSDLNQRYANIEDVLQEQAPQLLRYYDPAFIDDAHFKLHADRTTWIISSAGQVVFQDATSMAMLEPKLTAAIDLCLAGQAPVLDALTTAPATTDTTEVTAQLKTALAKMRVEYDEIEDRRWVYDRRTPTNLDHNCFAAYIGLEPGGLPWLRLRIQFTADQWLFIKSYLIKADDERFEYAAADSYLKREAFYGGIAEWLDRPLTASDRADIEKMIAAKQVDLRHIGQNHIFDRKLSSTEIDALERVLSVYDLLVTTCNLGLDIDSILKIKTK